MEQKESVFYPIHGPHRLLPSLIFHWLYDHENTCRRSLYGFGVGELFGFCFSYIVVQAHSHEASTFNFNFFFQVYHWSMSYLFNLYIYIFVLLNILQRTVRYTQAITTLVHKAIREPLY